MTETAALSTTLLPPDGLTPRVATVRAVRRETTDTATLDLDVGDVPIAFTPGQFDMLGIHGVGEAAISISSDPHEPTRISHTVRAVGWVTRELVELVPGDQLGVRGPYGRGWPLDSAVGGDLVIVAGGIGLAPVRPAVLHALAHRDHYDRVALLVGARTPGELLYRTELEAWGLDGRLEVAVTVDRADPTWTGTVGVVTRLVERVGFDPARTTVLTCGPEIMMRFVARAMTRRGVPADHVHVSLERNMRCAVGTCGHCQLGPVFVCRDGPVFAWPDVEPLLEVREL